MLANVMRKPMPQIFKEFQGTHYDLEEYLRHDWSSAGDVKYHLGTSMDRSYPDGRRVGCRVSSLRLPLLIRWKLFLSLCVCVCPRRGRCTCPWWPTRRTWRPWTPS